MAAPKLKYAIGNSASTTAAAGITNSDTSVSLTADTNFQAKSGAGMILMDEGNAGEELAYSTGISGGAAAIPLANRGLEGGSAQAHSGNFTIKGIFSSGMWNDLIDSLLNVLSQSTGALDTTKVVDLTTAQTLTNKALSTGSSMAESLLTLTDITTNDVSTSKHGFAPKAPNDTTKFLRGDASWAVPPTSTIGADGWTSVSDSWSYASANTVTVPSGAASLYQVGDRIKFTQTTVKYFVVTAVADTLLTVAVSTDYVVANAAISSISYSHQLNPIGFPSFFNYTPTGVAASNVTLTGRFSVMGRLCHTRIKAAFSGAITFTTMPTIPITASSSIIGGSAGSSPCGTGGYLDNGSVTSSDGLTPSVPASATTVTVTKSDGSALSATVPITWANGDTMTLDFAYEI